MRVLFLVVLKEGKPIANWRSCHVDVIDVRIVTWDGIDAFLIVWSFVLTAVVTGLTILHKTAYGSSKCTIFKDPSGLDAIACSGHN